jgi:hypothetical protein
VDQNHLSIASRRKNSVALSSPIQRPSQYLKPISVWLALAAIALGSGLLSPIAFHFTGATGLMALAVAAICCCLGVVAGRCAQLAFRKPESLVPRVLAGMLLRMGVPLGAALSVQLRGGPLAEAGFVYYVLMFYMLTLGVETVLWVRHG